jgi:hypothetical protein
MLINDHHTLGLRLQATSKLYAIRREAFNLGSLLQILLF